MFLKKRARLKKIIEECTKEFRPIKKSPHKNHWGVNVKIENLPWEGEIPEQMAKIDCHFIIVGIDKESSREFKKEIEAILDECFQKHLIAGQAFTEFSLIFSGNQNLTLRLFALGEFLGLWRIVTPKRLRLKGNDADIMASHGVIFIKGYKSEYSWV